jgi:hypothetical protein
MVRLCAPFFLLLGGSSVNDSAYIFGLSDADPSRLVLRKGPLAEGLSDVDPGSNAVLAVHGHFRC